jgi:hypothetical protein
MMESNGRGSFNYILLQRAKNCLTNGSGWGQPNSTTNGGRWINPISSTSTFIGSGIGRGNENPLCTRLLANDYPDINFYICQLQLLKGRSP